MFDMVMVLPGAQVGYRPIFVFAKPWNQPTNFRAGRTSLAKGTDGGKFLDLLDDARLRGA